MFKINKRVEYALIALKHMSLKKDSCLTSVKELCNEYSISFDVMSKVLQKLLSNKIVISKQGTCGGYCIVVDLKELSLLSLFEIVTSKDAQINCFSSRKSDCSLKMTCNIKGPMCELNNKLRDFYNSILVYDLLKS